MALPTGKSACELSHGFGRSLASAFPLSGIILTVLCLLSLTRIAQSDVRVEPTFGHPYVFADRIVFTSVNGKHLIAIDKKGRLQWKLTFPDRIFVQHFDDDLTVQTGRHVYEIDVANGKKSELLVMPENEVLIAEFGKDFLAAADRRFGHNRIRIINPANSSTAWESSSLESIVALTASTLVAVTADRKYENGYRAYHVENGALRGFDRKSGEIRWSIPLNAVSGASAHVGNLIALIDQLETYDPKIGKDKLLILRADTGVVLAKRQGNFTDLWPLEDSLGVFEASSGAEAAEFYVCKLPDCEKHSPIPLVAKEILKGRLYRNYIITAGMYDAACFERTTGKRLWEKGRLEWSEPFDDQMVITDFSPQEQSARIVSIDLATGQGHVLFSRTVTQDDKAAFRPW